MQAFDDSLHSHTELDTAEVDTGKLELQTTGAFQQLSGSYVPRSPLREEALQQKNTDVLPSLDAAEAISTPATWKALQLREENDRLRSLLAESEQAREQLFSVRRQEIERYEQQLQQEIDEYQQLELHYQELYHSFQDAVDEEANSLLLEVAHTLALPAEARPPATSEALQAIANQVRHMADQQIAEALYITRQAQRQVTQLEKQLAAEYQQLASERQQMQSAQASALELLAQRKRKMEARLRTRYRFSLSMIALLFLLLPLLQVIGLSLFHMPTSMPLFFSLFAPVFLYIVVGVLIGRAHEVIQLFLTSGPHRKTIKQKGI